MAGMLKLTEAHCNKSNNTLRKQLASGWTVTPSGMQRDMCVELTTVEICVERTLHASHGCQ